MRHMDIVRMTMPGAGRWTLADLGVVFIMWSAMMIAMMLPSATPMLLVYRQLAARAVAYPDAQSAFFAAGYALVWTLFSAAATLAQWGLHSLALLSPAMSLDGPRLGGLLLVVTGVYQWTALKRSCLAGCAAPLEFLSRHWQASRFGAWRMGLLHGIYCVGCCWMLMALLFVYGVMNLFWIGALTLYVLVEKLLPPRRWWPRLSGALLIAWGAGMMLR